jgi:photosystem II stability/assembly factor-like uncharacterized protein
MLIALAWIMAVSVYYLHPWTSVQPNAASRPVTNPQVLRYGIFSTYSFVSSALGWTLQVTSPESSTDGSYWVFKTVDAGRHWQRQLTGETLANYTGPLRFLDAHNGYVVAGKPLALYRTADGGDHWRRLGLPSAGPFWVQFSDPSHGAAVAISEPRPPGPMAVFTTQDGGETWTTLPDVPSNPGFWPRFRSSSEIWSGARVVEGRPFVYVSLDGGHTWSRRELPAEQDLPIEVLTTVDFAPGSRTALVYEYVDAPGPFHYYSTPDAGMSWTTLNSPAPTGGFGEVAFLDATHWWTIQDLGLYKTADAGHSWTRIADAPNIDWLIGVMDSRHAWAELDEGLGKQLVVTSDGGRHWTPTNLPAPIEPTRRAALRRAPARA